MSRAYAAALRDYPRRIRFDVTLVLSVLFLLPALKGYVEQTEWAGTYGLLIGALILIVWSGLISGHLKQVLARPQGRLLPNYARVQVRLALMLLVPAFAICLSGAILAGLRIPAALAMTLALTCLYWTWPYLFDRGNMLLLFGPASVWWLTLLANNPRFNDGSNWLGIGWPMEVWWTLAIAICLTILVVVTHRMLHLTESSFEYRSNPSMGWRSGSSPDSDTPFVGFFRRLLPWLGHYRIGPRSSVYRASRRERISQWRRGMGPRSPVVTGLSMAAMTALVGAYFLLHEKKSPSAELGILLGYLFIFPFSRFSYTHRRRVRLETEALFPARQSEFVAEMGAATAIDILGTWFFLCAGTMVARACGLFTTVAWSSFPYLLLLSLGATCFGIGLVPWILRFNGDKWPSFLLSMLVAFVGGLATLFLRTVAGFGMPLIWIAVFLLLVALGALGVRQGYHLWCRLELGRNEF